MANNEASSSGYLTLAKELFLKLNRNPIAETYTSDVYGFLNRSGSRKTEETFTFTNSNPKTNDDPFFRHYPGRRIWNLFLRFV